MSNSMRLPLDVKNRYTYTKNWGIATHKTGRLMLFAGDQKVEHLNDDFFGEGISPENNNPEHMFEIASKARIGAFATQIGFIARYGIDYPKIPYIVKLNAKTNLVPTAQRDPMSKHWISVKHVVEFQKNSRLSIVGVGYTLYLGSEFESEMLYEAANIVREAHEHGLLTVIWAYPRGKAVTDEKNPHLIAGAAGVIAALGADFAKVNYPKDDHPAEALREAVKAAGRTGIICAGGASEEVPTFLQTLHDQIHIAKTAGSATGRNIHQNPLKEAVRFCNAISAITLDNKSVE